MMQVHLGTVDAWVRTGCPVEVRPLRRGQPMQFVLKEVVDWLIARAEEKARGTGGEGPASAHEDAKRRKAEADAELAELDLAERRGQVASISQWQAATAAIVGSARAKLRGLGSKLGPSVAAESDPFRCRGLIDQAVDECLLELSEEELSIDAGGDGSTDAGDEAVSEVVGASAAADGQ